MRLLTRCLGAALLLCALPGVCPGDEGRRRPLLRPLVQPFYAMLGDDAESTDSVMMFCLVRSEPRSGAIGVSAVQPLRLWFSKPVAPASISQDSVRLIGAMGNVEKEIPVSLVFEPEKNGISVQPLEPLETFTSYTLSIAGDLVSSDGETLKRGYWPSAPKPDEEGRYAISFRTAGLAVVHSLSDRPVLEPAKAEAGVVASLEISPVIERRANGWNVVAPGWVTVSLPAQGLERFQLNWIETTLGASPRSRNLAPNAEGRFETKIEVQADHTVHVWGEAVTTVGKRVELSTAVVTAPTEPTDKN